jgi:phosphatidylinositol alpha-1,6-mannosyltransferase
LKSLKTLLVSEHFPPKTGGSGRWFWEIYRRLPRELFCIAAGANPKQQEFDRTHDLHLTRLALRLESWGVCSIASLKGYWRGVKALRRIVRAEGVQQIHCGRCLPEGLMALALKCWSGIPYVCYVHGEEVNYATASRELRWLARRVLNSAQFIVINSVNTGRLLKEEWQVPAEQLRLLYPGVDTELFVPAERDEDVRAHLGWGQRPTILTVGRLQKRKGHDQMILALPAIKKAIPEVLYAIVGDGEEREFLQSMVAQEGLGANVQFLGEVNDAALVRCYQQCDLFVLPNRQVDKDIEGFGMVLVEAQACGKPVVAGASGGTAETMQIPQTGLVVNCDGPQPLAALVTELLADPERLTRMGTAARQWVVERFDWTALSRQAAGLFGCAVTAAAASLEPVHS